MWKLQFTVIHFVPSQLCQRHIRCFVFKDKMMTAAMTHGGRAGSAFWNITLRPALFTQVQLYAVTLHYNFGSFQMSAYVGSSRT